MKTAIRKMGHSHGVIIPKPLLADRATCDLLCQRIDPIADVRRYRRRHCEAHGIRTGEPDLLARVGLERSL
jgi:hypothetical protein